MSAYKPKIYRSQDGCCICKAKSSSSRFTDSGKYEEDCQSCFCLADRRTGEICNACVLIVKRWKKLPRNTAKNWAHVVDARVGPGTKNIFKQKKKDTGVIAGPSEKFKHKHVYRRRKNLKTLRLVNEESGILSDSAASTRSESPGISSRQPFFPIPSFLDSSYWSPKTVCCGVLYTNELGEVAIDLSRYRPCSSSRHRLRMDDEVKQSSSVPSLTSSSTSAFSPPLNPSSIESLVEAELQAFQRMETETEDEEFYVDATKILNNDELNSSNEYEGDEGFCDRLDQKSEQFPSSLSLIATH
jgi:hypothetical protein